MLSKHHALGWHTDGKRAVQLLCVQGRLLITPKSAETFKHMLTINVKQVLKYTAEQGT